MSIPAMRHFCSPVWRHVLALPDLGAKHMVTGLIICCFLLASSFLRELRDVVIYVSLLGW